MLDNREDKSSESMSISETILYQLSKRDIFTLQYSDPCFDSADPNSETSRLAYAQHQFNSKIRNGLGMEAWEQNILELGCGHGGISAFLAVGGAASVTGIDINTADLEIAEKFCQDFAIKLGCKRLPVTFVEMSAEVLAFASASFDLVIADNLFEHVADIQKVMEQTKRVLRPGGYLLIPNVPSIYSKYGAHLKYGISVPWVNIFFSEKTIIAVMQRMAKDDPKMYVFYPGLRSNPQRIRDVRKYRDLNYITYDRLKGYAAKSGFSIRSFYINASGYFGKLLGKVPFLGKSILRDVFSNGATIVLQKPTDPDK